MWRDEVVLMKALLLGLLFATGCKQSAATTQDAGDGGIYGGAGSPHRGGASRDAGSTDDAGKAPAKSTCSVALNNGTAKLDTNANIDTYRSS
jgi:hypothetical protein